MVYKYFKELDYLDNFKVYTNKDDGYSSMIFHCVDKACYSDEVLRMLQNVLPKIKILDLLMEGINRELEMQSFKYTRELNETNYEEMMDIGAVYTELEEEYPWIKHMKKQIDLKYWDFISLMSAYKKYSSDLKFVYSESYSTFFESLNVELREVVSKMDRGCLMKIPNPKKNDYGVITWPNAWYITPHGYLYNTGDRYKGSGHKEGSLVYPFDEIIELLSKNMKIPTVNNSDYIQKILARSYITEVEFCSYSSMINQVPSVIIPEIEKKLELWHNISLNMPYEEQKMLHINDLPVEDLRRTYQKNIITLIVGYLDARSILFQSFARMNDSNYKVDLARKIVDVTHVYLDHVVDLGDLFVRYVGFSKIETQREKTITTSHLNGIEEFSEYLSRGWDLDIIPGICYDKTLDKLSEVDFNSYFIQKYLDKQLENYNGKGKVRVKK